jgi:hypothetical protein
MSDKSIAQSPAHRMTTATIREKSFTPAVDKTLDTMISVMRLGPLQRVLVAGDDSMELYLALRRRGFLRTTTPALCRVPRAARHWLHCRREFLRRN